MKVAFPSTLPRTNRHLRGWLTALSAFVALSAPAQEFPPVSSAPAGRATLYLPPENAGELLRVDDEMRAYFDGWVNRRVPEDLRIDQLVHALIGPKGLRFNYEDDGNYDAPEAFRRRRGNCVSFSILLVAVARDYGLKAQFHEVVTLPRWGRVGEFVTEVRHINTILTSSTGTLEVDLLPQWDREIAQEGGLAPISDARAFSQLYGNVGVLQLAEGDNEAALKSLRLSVAADPGCAVAWTNLGTALSRSLQYAEAERCYLRAMSIKPLELAAVGNLARLYARTGEEAKAARLEKMAQRHRARNPYHQFVLARHEFEAGRFDAAQDLLKRALALKRDEPLFLEWMARVAEAQGREKDARRWEARLQALQQQLPDRRGPS